MSSVDAILRVLLIDSNVYFVKRMTEALEKEGFEVLHHPVASYALTMIEWNPPDIILCATELREMGAFEIVPMLRNDPSVDGGPTAMKSSSFRRKARPALVRHVQLLQDDQRAELRRAEIRSFGDREQ